MESVWKKKFEKRQVKFPSEIAIEYCNQLYDLTSKLVIAKVESYEKNIDDMNVVAPLMAFASSSKLLKGTTAEDNLGAVSENDKFTYELYLTGNNTPKYKYRFCFIENGIYPYPVTIVLDGDIANELGVERTITCKSEDEYKRILINILNSKKMDEVIEGLMHINIKR